MAFDNFGDNGAVLNYGKDAELEAQLINDLEEEIAATPRAKAKIARPLPQGNMATLSSVIYGLRRDWADAVRTRVDSRTSRLRLLRYMAAAWSTGWLLAVLLFTPVQLLLMLALGLPVMALVRWRLVHHHTRRFGVGDSGRRLGAIFLRTYGVWALLCALPLVVFSVGWVPAEWKLIQFGWGLAAIWIIRYFLTVNATWLVEVRPGEQYFFREHLKQEHQFVVRGRPRPNTDDDLQSQIDDLVEYGMPVHVIETYLDYSGTDFLDNTLRDTLKRVRQRKQDQTDIDELRAMAESGQNPDEFYARLLEVLSLRYRSMVENRSQILAGSSVIDARATTPEQKLESFFECARRITQDPVLWVRPKDTIFKLWDREKLITISTFVPDINAQEGITFGIQLIFSLEFDPSKIQIARVRQLVPKMTSLDRMAELMRNIFEKAAQREARRYFIDKPIESSLAEESINTFRRALTDKLLERLEQRLGCSILGWSIECIPGMPAEVALAAIDMLAAKYKTRAENVWLEHVLAEIKANGAPPDQIIALLAKIEMLRHLPTHARVYGNTLGLNSATSTQRAEPASGSRTLPTAHPQQALNPAVPPASLPEVASTPLGASDDAPNARPVDVPEENNRHADSVPSAHTLDPDDSD